MTCSARFIFKIQALLLRIDSGDRALLHPPVGNDPFTVGFLSTIENTALEDTILTMLDEAEKRSPWLDVFTRPVDCQRHVCLITAESV